ncbi:MAG: hypothetical protein SPG74_05735 [Eubacteriales bacterium]|nr:hypothetical protein [Eubacterium sp.]MDY5356015.1 hypothetical protein [Eubacteriales bacterium]
MRAANINLSHGIFSEGLTEERLEKVIRYLPREKAEAVASFCAARPDGGKDVTEIRLRAGAPLSLTVGMKNVILPQSAVSVSTERELGETLGRLCEDSVHTYGETIKEGYVTLSGGYRIGVCGSARSEGERVKGVYPISSLCIRIPHAITGVCNELLREIKTGEGLVSALIYSPPGEGKTTLLRDAARRLSSGADAVRVCIIDTRGEIYLPELFSGCIADVMCGYPRAKGMEIAARTMSAQLIVCDEIGTAEEADAIISVSNTGIPLLASAHGSSFDDIMRRPPLKKLAQAGVFRKYIGIRRNGGGYALSVDAI